MVWWQWFLLAVAWCYLLWLGAAIVTHIGRVADRLTEINEHLKRIGTP